MDFAVVPDLYRYETEHSLGHRPHGPRFFDGSARHARGGDGAEHDPRRSRRVGRGAGVDGQRLNLSFAVLLITAAALGDRYGRRRFYAAGLGLFAVASAGCALAPDAGWLIAARAVQGVGAALVMPLGLALLAAAFPPERRGAAIGIFSA